MEKVSYSETANIAWSYLCPSPGVIRIFVVSNRILEPGDRYDDLREFLRCMSRTAMRNRDALYATIEKAAG